MKNMTAFELHTRCWSEIICITYCAKRVKILPFQSIFVFLCASLMKARKTILLI